MKASTRAFSNTFILYGRVILTAGISLLTTRLVLKALGEVDYGIFTLLSGVIVMMAFLNNALANSTQRFFSFIKGTKNIFREKEVFSNSLFIHICLGLVLFILLEILGLFLFDNFLNIPSSKINSAKIVYHFMCFDIFFTIISVPYNATLIARENIIWVAFQSILVVILKLLAAISIAHFETGKLWIYSLFIALITLINYLLYAIYCCRKYPECVFIFSLKDCSKTTIKELTSFAGWNLLGVLGGMGRTQGIPLVLNLFYGTVINTAYGISYQISGQLNFVSSSLLRAVNPQIMKSEGGGDRNRMLRISMFACKTGYILIALIVIPFMFEIESVLSIWLDEVPQYSQPICLFVLTYFLIIQLTIGLDSAIQAIGDLKKYSIVTSIVRLMTLPVGFFFLKAGFSFYFFFWIFLFFEVIASFLRVYFTTKLTGLGISTYFNKVLLRLILPTSVAVIISYLMTHNLMVADFRFLKTIFISAFFMSLTYLILGMELWERKLLKNIFFKIIDKVKSYK